ncbi:MAG: hypothetical protein E7588_06530 [Ruminococcaceae bacterium]|nr:hypothetical protein [Oscillospiraceae bacterium]
MIKYIFNRDKLPRPFLEGREDLTQLYYKAWELAFKNVEYIDKEGWNPQLTCMPGVNTVWQWDSCIMVFITNYSNGTISALNNLDNLYRLRRTSDGYMSMAYRISTEKEAFGERINPPLMAWAEWSYFMISGDDSRFEKVLPALEGLYSFINTRRTRSCGLYYFEDPGSSGMDNAPRGGYPAVQLLGSDVCFIDLACQQALTARHLALICRHLKDNQKADFYDGEHARICGLINKYHYSEKTGFYYDFFARGSADAKVKLINTKTAAAFWALTCGAATGERADSVIRHMTNPDEFYTNVPFASLSADDLNYMPDGGYWLGGVWAPTNFAAIRGLCDAGRHDLARESAIKYLDAVAKVENDPDYTSIWEVYSPTEHRPALREEGTLCRKDFVGWSGLAPITLFIENIIGLTFDAPKNTVTFRLNGKKCGLDNMEFNGAKLSVECTHADSAKGATAVSISAEKPLTLRVISPDGNRSTDFSVTPGNNTFSF